MDLKEIFDKWANIKNTYIIRNYSIQTSHDNETIITLGYNYSKNNNTFSHTDKIKLPEDYEQMQEGAIKASIQNSEDQFYERLKQYIDHTWYLIEDSDKVPPKGEEIDLVYYFPTFSHDEDGINTRFSLLFTRGHYDGKKIESIDKNINFEEYRGNIGLYAWKEI